MKNYYIYLKEGENSPYTYYDISEVEFNEKELISSFEFDIPEEVPSKAREVLSSLGISLSNTVVSLI